MWVFPLTGLVLSLQLHAQQRLNRAGNRRGMSPGSKNGRDLGQVKKGERRQSGRGRGNPKLSPLFPDMLVRVRAVAAEHAPWVLETDQFALEIFVGLLVGCEEMRAYLDGHGWLDGEGKTRAVVHTYMRAMSKAGTEAERLGFTPSARVDLGFKAAATEVAIRPIRTLERSKEVASILGQIGALPRPAAEVIEGTAVEVSEAEYRSTSPKPTPEGLRVPRNPRRVVER
jgi:hypothetical protein